MTEQGIDKVLSLLKACGQGLLADLVQAGCAPRVESACLDGQGWTLYLAVQPTPPRRPPGLSEVEHAILHTLERFRDTHLPAERILREIQKQTTSIVAEITLKRSLKRLKQLGLIRNSKKQPRGYYLVTVVPP